MNITFPSSYNDIDLYYKNLHTFLSAYPLFVSGFHLFDFFEKEKNIWDDVSWPTSWKSFIDDNIGSVERLADWIDDVKSVFLHGVTNDKTAATWPSSLVEFINTTHNLALPRSSVTGSLADLVDISSLPPIPNEEQCSKSHMSRKKLHESERLAAFVKGMANKTNADLIIDIGAGRGYLTYLLANIAPVLAVESIESRTHGAQQRHAKLPPSVYTIKYTTQYLTQDNISDLAGKSQRVIVVGLHACGDLGGRLLLGLLNHPTVVGVASVGCCYQMMDTNAWPLCPNETKLPVTQQSFSLACQTYNAKPDLDLIASMRGFHNRALFQHALNAVTTDRNNTKHAMKEGEDWQDAVRRHAGACAATEHAITQTRAAHDTPRDTARITFASLIKSRFGPLIESAILLDRVRYATQCAQSHASSAHQVGLSMLFEQSISPRNSVVWAWRQ